LQRFRRKHWLREWYVSELEGLVQGLSDVNADPTIHDQLGNTALHYLATDELMNPGRTEHIRKLLKTFVERGVDINARNHADRSAIELFLEDHSRFWDKRNNWGSGGDVLDVLTKLV
jgi:hypothetical protein